MKRISTQDYDVLSNSDHSNCKVIPISECNRENLEDKFGTSFIGRSFNRDFSRLFYFVPVAIMSIIIFPVMYFLLFCNHIKSMMIKIGHFFMKGL